MSLKAKNVGKNHYQASNTIQVLSGLDLEVNQGESVAIVGKSGSGKSTLLSMLAGLDHPEVGDVWLGGEKLTGMNETDLSGLRAKKMGIIFQQFQLVQTLNALENVMLPLEILGNRNAKSHCLELLGEVGLGHRAHHFPNQLSGGEQQRVAIARAMAAGPEIILADEPTGNLDQETGAVVMNLLFSLSEKKKSALVLVTHDLELAKRCSRVLHLEHGKLIS
jgi:putative ABC transport system ATP-binding protein